MASVEVQTMPVPAVENPIAEVFTTTPEQELPKETKGEITPPPATAADESLVTKDVTPAVPATEEVVPEPAADVPEKVEPEPAAVAEEVELELKPKPAVVGFETETPHPSPPEEVEIKDGKTEKPVAAEDKKEEEGVENEVKEGTPCPELVEEEEAPAKAAIASAPAATVEENNQEIPAPIATAPAAMVDENNQEIPAEKKV